jgi:hypothetical protein
MTRLEDALRGLDATTAARIRQAVRAEARAARRPSRVSYGAEYTPPSGKLAGVTFRNRGEYKTYRDLVAEANKMVRENGYKMPERGTPEYAALTRVGHRLFARLHRDDRANRDNWVWLIEGWY